MNFAVIGYFGRFKGELVRAASIERLCGRQLPPVIGPLPSPGAACGCRRSARGPCIDLLEIDARAARRAEPARAGRASADVAGAPRGIALPSTILDRLVTLIITNVLHKK
ncbi:hypothetical protein EVAR_41765_1 [Eumeta japonica]|uniref:Uncharacterized protein n=1 Tax=Eumeta variegata TaxID=151549 RepID=A0A4C1W076_EUMVA|nr:hypothetical protein EVAR_41765_1 [Eumeta japonica]